MCKTVEEVLEDIQEAMVNCGGRFVRRDEFAEMEVQDLLGMLLPNKVEFTVKHNPKGTK